MSEFIPKELIDMYIGLEGDSQTWRVDFDNDLIQELTEDGWIEFVHQESSGKELHRLYNPVAGPVKFISWNEK